MSVHVLSWVLRHSDEEGSARLVLLVLADHAHADGTNAYPTVETIRHHARLKARSTVQRALRGLEERGAIKAAGKGREGQANWTILMGPQIEAAASTASGGRNDDAEGPRDAAQPVPNPSSNRSTTSDQLPGMDNRQQLIREWMRIFDKSPTQPFSPSRIKAAERALKEESDLPTLVRALEGAKRFRSRKPGTVEFSDIFGTFRGTGDLASRIAFWVEQAGPSADGLAASIPSGARVMVKTRQRLVEDMMLNPGDADRRARAGDSERYLRQTWGLTAHLGDDGSVRWEREVR